MQGDKLLSNSDYAVFVEFIDLMLENDDIYTEVFGEEFIRSFAEQAAKISVDRNREDIALKVSNLLPEDSSYRWKIAVVAKNYELASEILKGFLERKEEDEAYTGYLNLYVDEGLQLALWQFSENCESKCQNLYQYYHSDYLTRNTKGIFDGFENYEKASMYFFAILTDFQKSVSTKSVDINLIKEISNSSKGEVVQFNTTPFYYESPTELISLAIDYYSQTEDGRWNWTDPKQGEKWGELVYSGYMRNELKTIIDTLRNEYDRVSEIQKTDPSNENLRRLDLLEGPILEASFYNALSSIKLGNCKGAWFDLNSVESYGDSPDSLAHNYMEIDLRDLLLDRNILEKLCELDRSIFDGNLKAVLIGIDDYSSTRVTSESNTKPLYPIGDLKYATSDAIAVNDLLLSQKMGWDTQLLINEDATLKKAREVIGSMLRLAGENDTILIYFSGHGRSAPFGGDEETYFLTSGVQHDDGYGGLPYVWLNRNIERSPAKHVILIVDACRAGNFQDNKGDFDRLKGDSDLILENFSKDPSRLIFVSGEGAKAVFEDDELEHGVFTYFLLEALKGKASEISDEAFVNLNEIIPYVTNEVQRYSIRNGTIQIPTDGSLTGTSTTQLAIVRRN